MIKILIISIIQISLKGNNFIPFENKNSIQMGPNKFGPVFTQSTNFGSSNPVLPQIEKNLNMPYENKTIFPIVLPNKFTDPLFLSKSANCPILEEMKGFKNFNDKSEFKQFGSPSDLIPIAWFSIWNQLRAPSNGVMTVIHASAKGDQDRKFWRFVFKILDSNETSYYAVLADSDLNVKKHIGTEELNDIKFLFSLPDLDPNIALDIPYQKEALLHNSPFIPNPDYDPDLDDIDIKQLVEVEIKNNKVDKIEKQLEEMKKQENLMNSKEKKLEIQEKRIQEKKHRLNQKEEIVLLGESEKEVISKDKNANLKENEEKKQIPIEEKKEIPIEEKKEIPIEEKKEIPIEEKKEIHIEEKKEMPIEEKKEIPIEEKKEIPIEEKKEIPIEEKKEIPIEEKKEIPIEEKKEIPIEEKKEMPIEENKEIHIEEKKEIPIEEKKEIHIEEKKEIPIEEKKEIPIEEKKEIPIEEKKQIPIEQKRQIPFEQKKEIPIEEKKQMPIEEKKQNISQSNNFKQEKISQADSFLKDSNQNFNKNPSLFSQKLNNYNNNNRIESPQLLGNSSNLLTTTITQPSYQQMVIKTFPINDLPPINPITFNTNGNGMNVNSTLSFGAIKPFKNNNENLLNVKSFNKSFTNPNTYSISSFDLPIRNNSLVSMGNTSKLDF